MLYNIYKITFSTLVRYADFVLYMNLRCDQAQEDKRCRCLTARLSATFARDNATAVPTSMITMDIPRWPQQEENSSYTPNMDEVEASMEVLAPTRLVWHQEQAGIIPNSCPDTLYSNIPAKSSAAQAGSGSTSADDWMRKNRDEDRPNLYWHLYMSRAAYRMALEEEIEDNVVYDWIVHARFDATWIRPIPPLSLFSREAVWLDASSW